MNSTNSRPAELAIPVASLTALRHALADEVGDDAAARALQVAGVAAGHAFYDTLAYGVSAAGRNGEADPAEWSEATFWRRLGDLFQRRGWGRIRNHEPLHTGVGALDAFDWVEAEPEAGAARPSCFFTAGLLANLLGRVVGDDVAVLEVGCRSRGDEHCRFLYGSPETLDVVFARIRSGADIEETLATLA
jgi:predicted hydrocarbon binding protein